MSVKPSRRSKETVVAYYGVAYLGQGQWCIVSRYGLDSPPGRGALRTRKKLCA